MTRRVPEIIIIGTMKGGTTILWTHLRNHPQVEPGVTKEIHYFTMHREKSVEWYIHQFPDREPTIYSVDASPTYFDSAVTAALPRQIQQVAPDSHIILTIRDPVERAVSHFHQLKRSNILSDMFENIDINEFFSRPLERRYSFKEPSDEHFGYVLDFSIYDQKFSNYLEVYTRDKILLIENDNIVSDLEDVMKQVYKHCNLYNFSIKTNNEKYVTGSKIDQLEPEVKARLASLFYPSYNRFRALAGLPQLS